MIKLILTIVLALGLTSLIETPASGEETLPVTDTTQCSLIQQALIIELNPQIMSILRQKYHNNFLFANVHVLPIKSLDDSEFEFILEMTVMKGEQPEKVQMTFRRDGLNGYMVAHLNVFTPEKHDLTNGKR
ncbi:hypothetical protein [Paenibacillus xylanivorans]|uniref:DUF3888 domain-containing protein n=1 Tax=Paenibacillus xylanivorans TaxID=1705561 RepID=A0A0N0C4K1_9BACL|nr:hypothetical protein [Paenibacillus xylanivorans]KOY15897.1 hypothetical protein AMS66_14815 [Paenibacillus xylanivorans]